MELSKRSISHGKRTSQSLFMETCLKLSSMHSRTIIQRHQISVANGDVKYLDGGLVRYHLLAHGLLRLAERRH